MGEQIGNLAFQSFGCRLVFETDLVIFVSVPQPTTIKRTPVTEKIWVYCNEGDTHMETLRVSQNKGV